MDNDTGFVLNIPEIPKYNANLPKESFFATTSSSGFNASGMVDCAFVINNSDGSHDIIVSGAVDIVNGIKYRLDIVDSFLDVTDFSYKRTGCMLNLLDFFRE